MELSRTERWMLANQYRILEALYPDEADAFAEAREALESGYELHYRWLAERIYDAPDTMTAEECTEVVDILDMHRALKRSYEALSDKSGIEEYAIQFHGFDGNNETKQLAYARFFCNLDGGRFTELDRGDDFNSHMPSLDTYRRMLAEWKRLDKSHELSRDQIVKITEARVHPSRRGK